MAFDLSTAKPEEEKETTGFDLSTAKPEGEPPAQETSFLDQLVGGAEGALSLASGIVAEPLAGVAGLAAAADPFSEEGAGAQMVERVRNALTFQPGTSEGKAAIGNLGEALQPVAEKIDKFRKFIGDDAFDATGSPAIAAIVTALPDAMLELLPAKKLIPTKNLGVQSFQAVPNAANKVSAVRNIDSSAKKALNVSAPSTQQLKEAATTVYNQIDDIGVQVKPNVITDFGAKTAEKLRKAGFDAELDPLVNRALTRINEIDGPISTGEITILRTVAQKAVKSVTPSEARLGRILINEFDDLLSNLKPGQTVGGDVKGLGGLYQKAGELWRRSVKSDTVGDLFDNAELRIAKDGVGFKDAISGEFLSLIKKNRKTKQFNPEEITQMRKVVDQGKVGTALSFIGRLDLTQQQKANAMFGVSTFGAGVAVGGPLGVAVPAVGFVTRSLADKLVKGKGEFAQSIVAAGNDGQKIAKEYLKKVPKNQRDSAELTQLLINRDVNLDGITLKSPIVIEAVQNAKIFTPTELAVAFGLATPEQKQTEEEVAQ